MTEADLINIMIAEITDILPELEDKHITGDDSLVGLGLNSMDRVDVIVAAQSAADTHVAMTQFASATCISDIASVIRSASV